MPGFSVTDFGDAIRFGANTAAEDEKDLSKVSLDIEMFDIYTKGFLAGCGGLLGEDEIMLLPEGAKMMTLECGMRFLTDYIDGKIDVIEELEEDIIKRHGEEDYKTNAYGKCVSVNSLTHFNFYGLSQHI